MTLFHPHYNELHVTYHVFTHAFVKTRDTPIYCDFEGEHDD